MRRSEGGGEVEGGWMRAMWLRRGGGEGIVSDQGESAVGYSGGGVGVGHSGADGG